MMTFQPKNMKTCNVCFNYNPVSSIAKSESSFFQKPICPVLRRTRCGISSTKRSSCINTFMLASSSSPPKTISEGTLIHYQTSSGRLRLGRAVRPDGKRNWIVEDTEGLSLSITPKQIEYILGNPTDNPDLEDINVVEKQCCEMATENEELIEVAWEMVSSGGGIDDTTTTDVTQIAEIVFDSISPLTLFAAHLLLSNDRIFFKQKNIKGRIIYEAKTEGNVKEVLLLREAELQREREKEELRRTLLQSFTERSVGLAKTVIAPEKFERLVANLQTIALELESRNRADSRFGVSSDILQNLDKEEKIIVKDLMDSISKPLTALSAFEVLVAWGIFSKHENLMLMQPQVSERISVLNGIDLMVDEVINNVPRDLDIDVRVDYTKLLSFAIDSEDTTEIDDAISWDSESERVLIHVADPSRYFPEGPSHALIQNALRKVATIYLPDAKFTMFPKRLAENLFSLCGASSDGSALTISFSINSSGEIESDTMKVEPSRIAIPVRISYEEAEQILSDEAHEWHELLSNLLRVAKIRHEWREMEGGAIIINNPFPNVVVSSVNDEEPDIIMNTTDTVSDPWLLVAELMISACTVAACIAEAAEIPVPFRGQQPFDYPPDEVLESVPDGPVRASLIFKNATPSEINTHAMEHASLGLDAYLQVTSPIRRSNDLVTHFQLKAHLRGDPLPFSTEGVQEDITRTNDLGRVMRNLENRTRRYWQYEQLRRWGPTKLHKGVFVRFLKDKEGQVGFIHLHDYGFQVVAQLPGDAVPGNEFEVKITMVDPRTSMIRCEANRIHALISKPEAEKVLDDALSDISIDSLESVE